MKRIILTTAALALAAPAAFAAPNGHNNGKGWGVGHVPPGHQKTIEAQQVVDNYVVVDNPTYYGLYGLTPLPDGQVYVTSNGKVYAIDQDTATVVAAIGIMANILAH